MATTMTGNDTIRIGTRGSRLARIQTDYVRRQVHTACPGVALEVLVIRTAGDEDPGRRPARMSGTGIFTRAIERALLAGEIDMAVHSLKDLPTAGPPGLTVAAIPVRADPWDALVGCKAEALAAAAGLRLGTSSIRRAAQIRRAYPGCDVVELRGNLDTRLRKVEDGLVDGAILAVAGLQRFGRADAITHIFAADIMLPAPGQGALAIQTREDDAGLRALLAPIHCERTAACVTAERAFLHALDAGCRTPVGALAEADGNTIVLRGRVISLDGARCLEAERAGHRSTSAEIGRALAAQVLAAGAAELLRQTEREMSHE